MREVEEMYTILFSSPKVEAITVWDAVDGKWLNAPSGLLRRDNSMKPAYTRLKELISKEWSTDAVLSTDENGRTVLEGFRGEYVLSMEGRKTRIALTTDSKEVNVVL